MIPLMSKPRESILDAFNTPKTKLKIRNPGSGLNPTVELYGETLRDGDEFYITDEIEIQQTGGSPYHKANIIFTYFDGTSETLLLDGASMILPATKYIKQIEIVTPILGLESVQRGTLTVDPFTYGVFDSIAQILGDLEEPPVYAGILSGLDFDYLTNHASSKAVSNLLHIMLAQNGETNPDTDCIKFLCYKDRYKLAERIFSRFGDAWTHIYDALTAQYNPIENYSMTEETTPDLTDEFGVSDDYQTSRDRNVNTNVDTETGLYGFNSTTSVPTGTGNTSGSALDNTENETETQTGSRIETHTGKTTVERSGNIGVTTSQQMLQSEIDVRIKNHMEDIMFNDVDQVLTTAGFAPILSETINFI